MAWIVFYSAFKRKDAVTMNIRNMKADLRIGLNSEETFPNNRVTRATIHSSYCIFLKRILPSDLKNSPTRFIHATKTFLWR